MKRTLISEVTGKKGHPKTYIEFMQGRPDIFGPIETAADAGKALRKAMKR